MDDRLAVYIGAHPDDIDVGMSGSLFKLNLRRHPLMWIVVTDGGADEVEYAYESAKDQKSGRPWLKIDDLKSVKWKTPDGGELTRNSYSRDLVAKRCGIEFDDSGWEPHPARHPSSFGEEVDWRTRVADLIGRDVEARQLCYRGGSLYPDGSLRQREEAFTSSIAESLAREIYGHITAQGYSRDLVYISSHGSDAVCWNCDEHEDHRIAGNAALKAIGILLNLGIKTICSSWFTIYSPIVPRRGYSREIVDIGRERAQKSRLCRACWETEFLAQHKDSRMKSWGEDKGPRRYPDNPIDFEYSIRIVYSKTDMKLLQRSERHNRSLWPRLIRRAIPLRFRSSEALH
jgi:hypothetical protein